MNLSGGPVANLMKAYGVSPDEVIVIHDDLDLPSGSIRVKLEEGTRDIMACVRSSTRQDPRIQSGSYRYRSPTREDAGRGFRTGHSAQRGFGRVRACLPAWGRGVRVLS